MLLEHEAKEILEKYGIRTARCIFVDSEEGAVRAAKSIGFPVAMKVASRKIVHKSDVNGVRLNVSSEEEVRRIFNELIKIEGAEGVNVQPMLPPGIEVIVGVAENEQFGSIAMFGIGGVFVEALRDVSFRILPITRRDAEEMVREIKGYKVLQGYRGKKVDVSAIVEVLLKLNEIVEKENVVEMDLNPIFVYEKGYAVADARMVVGKRKRLDYQAGDLSLFFNPKSVAVVGASATIGKFGYNIVWNLKQHGFKGKIYPVNPKYDYVLEYKCYPSVADVPDQIDLAIIAVPAKFVPEILSQCAKKGVKGVVIVSSGFSEEGEEGAKIEKEVLKIAKQNGIRIFGPNTTGILNTENGLITSFALLPYIRRGNIGIIAQTGLFLGLLMEIVTTNHPSLGFSKIVGLGNKIDVEDYEVLNFLIRDPDTKVIGIYVEGFRNGRAFYDAVKNSEKPVVVFKTGRSEYGKKAALSHTAALAVDDRVFDAFCKQANVVRVFSFEEMFQISKAFSLQPLPKGDRVAIVHYTGSGCVQGADATYFAGLKLAEFENETIRKIESVNPSWHRVNNPVDIWPAVGEVGTQKAYECAVDALMSDKNVDSVVVAFWSSQSLGEVYQPDFMKLRRFRKPVYFVVEGSKEGVFEIKNKLELNGFPVYPDVITAINVLGKVTEYSRRKGLRDR
ncbi:MAG: acetate--CoA ligase family protein [Archaeoglobaceae archaeon]